MRIIDCNEVIRRIKELCISINYHMDPRVKDRLQESLEAEKSPLGREILLDLLQNEEIAQSKRIPLCQDTGMVMVFVEIGQEVKVVNGLLTEAIQEGVRQGYQEGFLRKSVVACPIRRNNTGDNTPAMISYDLVAGDCLKITVAAKGFGSENMSAIKMLTPFVGVEGIKEFVLETIQKAGANCCPTIVVGIGIGGSFDKVAMLSKKALLRDLGQKHQDPLVGSLEEELLQEINQLGIGPQGFGGNTTALAVHVETYPTHIAGLPVAVNINCHASRHGSMVL